MKGENGMKEGHGWNGRRLSTECGDKGRDGTFMSRIFDVSFGVPVTTQTHWHEGPAPAHSQGYV